MQNVKENWKGVKNMSEKLTPKQEKFVQNLIKGMSQREAYKKSYDTKNMKNETIDSKACLLFKQDKIRKRYDSIQQKAEDKAIMTSIERKKWLTGIINNDVKEYEYIINSKGKKRKIERNADLSTKIKAMDMLNKMEQEYVHKIEGSISVDEKLEDLL